MGALVLAALSAGGQTAGADRDANWKADLEFMRAGLSAKGDRLDKANGKLSIGQKDIETLYPGFATSIDSIEARAPALTDSESVFELMRLWAAAGVEHNALRLPKDMGFEKLLPVSLIWYSDELAVESATAPYESALGARVLRVGSMTPAELLKAAAPYIAHQNETWLRGQVCNYAKHAVFWKQLGLMQADGTVTMTLQKAGGEPFEVTMAAVDGTVPRKSMASALGIPVQLAQSQSRKNCWFQYLVDSKALYLQYDVCYEDKDLPFAQFLEQVFAATDANPVSRFVIDLRWNGGGDSELIRPLIKGLEKRKKKIGNLEVLIGEGTFSSAVLDAVDLRQELHATLIGEPTGGAQAGYGDVQTLTLPHSKVVVVFTTKYIGKPQDAAVLAPDMVVPLLLRDKLAGRDTVLEAALGR